MPLIVYNTLTRKKEEFAPLKKGKVGMYACGITAYDSCHVGHARSAIAWDIVYRWLRYRGYDVTFVKNYTDIDDKIINRAQKESRDWKDLTKFYISEYEDVMAKLNALPPTHAPRATEHIKGMIDLIKNLEKNGLAYKTDSGVYFSVRKHKGYGKLSGKSLDDLESGARISVDEKKNDPLDFALWKFKKPGEPSWPSPWGEGRPGWHIECSVMSAQLLGQPFDIHGGGRDLIFPHHENEIAQAEGGCGKQFAKYWLHNGFVNLKSEKMSKSLGNIVSLKGILEKYPPQAVRYFLMSAHYRSPLDYTPEAMQEAEAAVVRFYETCARLHKIHPGKGMPKIPKPKTAVEKELREKIESIESKIEEAMDDDFNATRALGFVFDLLRSINKFLDEPLCDCGSSFAGWIVLRCSTLQQLFDDVFGMFGDEPEKFLRLHSKTKSEVSGIDESKVEELLEQRVEARRSKDFKRADEIRDELSKMGVVIKDMPGGKTEWKIK